MNNGSREGVDISNQTPGQMIKAAREAKRVSVGEVVQRLLLSKQVILALEEDNYSKIPAQVYAEGYLKAYAQFLQIPVEPIIKSFRGLNIYSGHEIKKVEAKSTEESKFDINNLLQDQRIRFVVLIVAGVLVLSTLMFFTVRIFTGKNSNAATVAGGSVNTPQVTVTEQPSTANISEPTVEKSQDLSSAEANMVAVKPESELVPAPASASEISVAEAKAKRGTKVSRIPKAD